MNRDDLMIALSFLSVQDMVVLQCPSAKDVPYLKREVIGILGVPSRIIGNSLYYSREEDSTKVVRIISMGRAFVDCVGIPTDNLFYIGWKSNMDRVLLEEQLIEESWYPRVFDLWEKAKTPIQSRVRILEESGYLSGQIGAVLNECVLYDVDYFGMIF